jgi:hypothetical protein
MAAHGSTAALTAISGSRCVADHLVVCCIGSASVEPRAAVA